MRKFGKFEILGAAISTIGVMFLIMDCLAYFNVFHMEGAGFGMAIVSLLTATNGYLIMLFGIVSSHAAAATVATALQ